MTLTSTQLSALRELADVWPDASIVVIGATGLGFYYDMSWRKTADVDLVVAVELDAFPGGLDERDGWRQHPKKEHEFDGPQGVKLDILPAGREILAQGSITWRSGHVMNMAGMDLAFRHAEVHEVDRYPVHVAAPTTIALLKMAAYLDRPFERLRDLADIAYLLDIYVDEESPRRWDEAAEVGAFELAPAYLMGLDMARLGDVAHRGMIDTFLDEVDDPESVPHAEMQNVGPAAWRSQEDPLARRLRAFRDGLRDG